MERIEEWRIFGMVARLDSFARAAKAHGCSPQAVTRAIAAIESRVGVRLFHRTTRSVSLTAEGRAYLERSARTVAEVDALETRAKPDDVLRGVVSVTAPILYGEMHVAPLVTAFVREHRELDARLMLVDRVVSLADEGIDVAVRIGALPDSPLRVRLVGHVRSVVCASPALVQADRAPRTLASFEDREVIAFSATTPIPNRWSFPRSGKRPRVVRVRPRLAVNDGRAAIDAAVRGLGFVRVLSYQIEELVRAGKLEIVLARHEPPPVPIHLVQLPGVASRAASTLADFLATRLRQSG